MSFLAVLCGASPSGVKEAAYSPSSSRRSVSNRSSMKKGEMTPKTVEIQSLKDVDSDFDDSLHNNNIQRIPVTPSGEIKAPPKTSQYDKIMSSIASDMSVSTYGGRQYNSLGQIKIDWNELEIRTNNPKEAIIGHGSFGTVIKAYWKPKGGIGKLKERNIIASQDSTHDELVVAVKVFTRSLNGNVEYNPVKLYQQACDEVALIRQAEDRMFDTSRIVHAYGASKGPLTSEMCRVFRIQDGEEGIGVIMRFEGGGSLENIVHSTRKVTEPLTMNEKIRLLFEIARGLAELHAAGIVHADVKLENVLLSDHYPPKVRLADFGLSIFRSDESKIGNSTLQMTTHLRGTPIYCAPELLTNPFDTNTDPNKITIAQPSRKTDIYAYAIVAWEILSQQQPFGEVRTEGELCMKVHKGIRPPIQLLPPETPRAVIQMIDSCWKNERLQRKTAVECVSTLHYEYIKSKKEEFDIFFSHASVPKLLLSHIYHYFIRLGYKICGSGHLNSTSESLEMMKKSKLIILCFDKEFQTSTTCMREIRYLRENYHDKKILTLIIEEKCMGWANEQSKDLCALGASTTVDIGHIGRAHWDSEEGPDAAMLVALTKNLEPLKDLVVKSGCFAIHNSDGDRVRTMSAYTQLKSQDKSKTSKILAGLELCVAVYEGDLHYLRGLLESGCPVDASDYDFRTAAHICCAENMVQAALILYEYKADFVSDKVRDRWGRTPLEEAINHGHTHLATILKSLLEVDKEVILRASEVNPVHNVEKQDCVGLELCVAAFQGDAVYLRALLESGCPVGAADYDLRTAAHISCAENNLEIVKILHEFGADLYSTKVKDRFGVTPIMEAERHGHKDVVIFIQHCMAEDGRKRNEAKARMAVRHHAQQQQQKQQQQPPQQQQQKQSPSTQQQPTQQQLQQKQSPSSQQPQSSNRR